MDTDKGMGIVRANPAMEIRADDSAPDSPLMEVRFSAFNDWYEIDSAWEGKFMERVAPGAFKKTIQESGNNVKVLYDHGHDPQIGNKILGKIESLTEESDSPVGLVRLYSDTSYVKDLLPGLRDGAYGSSFMFRVVRDEWNDSPDPAEHNPAGIPERTIKEVRLFEFGPVTFPANPSATSGVRSRSMTDEYYDELRKRNPSEYDKLVARKGAQRTSLDRDAAKSADDEPVSDHSRGMSPQQRRRALNPYLAKDA